MIWVGIVVGLIIGCIMGFFLYGICSSAGRHDLEVENHLNTKEAFENGQKYSLANLLVNIDGIEGLNKDIITNLIKEELDNI